MRPVIPARFAPVEGANNLLWRTHEHSRVLPVGGAGGGVSRGAARDRRRARAGAGAGAALCDAGFPDAAIMPLALGTSLATIVFTSVSSMCAHHAKGAVDWGTLRRMTPGIVAGALASTALAAHLSPSALKLMFAIYAGLAATQLICNIQPPASRQLPGREGSRQPAAWLAGYRWSRAWAERSHRSRS